MWYICDVLYAVVYVCVSCFVVRGCAVSRRYIYIYNCDMFSVVNVYLDMCDIVRMLRECEGARLTAMLVWDTGWVWLR